MLSAFRENRRIGSVGDGEGCNRQSGNNFGDNEKNDGDKFADTRGWDKALDPLTKPAVTGARVWVMRSLRQRKGRNCEGCESKGT